MTPGAFALVDPWWTLPLRGETKRVEEADSFAVVLDNELDPRSPSEPRRRLDESGVVVAHHVLVDAGRSAIISSIAVVAKNVDRTTAHRDHIHFGLSWAGAR